MTECPHLSRLDRRDGLTCAPCDRLQALPAELAPAKRAAVEALLAEVRPHTSADHNLDTRPREERSGRGRCYVCGMTGGAMGGHHVRPGDHTSVVPVHPRCHRKLHRKPRRPAVLTG